MARRREAGGAFPVVLKYYRASTGLELVPAQTPRPRLPLIWCHLPNRASPPPLWPESNTHLEQESGAPIAAEIRKSSELSCARVPHTRCRRSTLAAVTRRRAR